jgi:hypothetical protein
VTEPDEPDEPAGADEPDELEEPEERRYPSTIGGAFYLCILIVALLGVGIVLVSEDWRLGVRLVAAALVAAAGLRLVLRQRDAGMLAVRHRMTDVVMLLLLGGGLFFLAGSIPDQPL